ncbi:MAG TPA: roadblock/LC7 domain-containing protein [Thermoanaerobaculia bacterium]|nr:roadblock/LC7 domain-containing protein [Thermoanaerobaculia bacterium]
MFLERLSRISDQIGGVLALSLVARDGIPIESVSSDPDLDLEVLAAELVAQARSISENHRDLNVGAVQQLSVLTDRLTLIVSAVTEEYYLLLVLGPEGNYGRARFELRRARLSLERDLL